jgi:hypothetical protein
LENVKHPDRFTRVRFVYVLILINLQHDEVCSAIEQKVRTILETFALVHHAIATLVLEPVDVQHVLDLVLFGKTTSIELVRVADVTVTLFV